MPRSRGIRGSPTASWHRRTQRPRSPCPETLMLRSVRCAPFLESFTAVEHGGAGRAGGVTLGSRQYAARSLGAAQEGSGTSAGALSGLCHNSVINAANLLVSCPLKGPPSAGVSYDGNSRWTLRGSLDSSEA